MANAKGAPNPITRESLVSDLRGLAEQAEGTGDRWVAPRALKLASHIELHGPANPVPPSVDKLIEICDTVAGGLIRSSCDNLGAAQMLARTARDRAGKHRLSLLGFHETGLSRRAKVIERFAQTVSPACAAYGLRMAVQRYLANHIIRGKIDSRVIFRHPRQVECKVRAFNFAHYNKRKLIERGLRFLCAGSGLVKSRRNAGRD